MTCLDAYATPAQYSEWWGYWQHKIDLTRMTADEILALEAQLKMAAGDINLALQQVGACNCTIAGYGLEFLKKLNCIGTAVVYKAPCGPRLSDDDRKLWLEQLNADLMAIRSGKIELCSGNTGAEYPAYGTAQPNWTPFVEEQLIKDGILKDSNP